MDKRTRDVQGSLKPRAARCPTLPIGFWAGWAFALQRAGWVGPGQLFLEMRNIASVKKNHDY